MDVLASCNVTELPEQQTRTQHLSERVLEDENLELGFSVCCHCASPKISVECPACRRVKYCSQECRRQDASIVHPTATANKQENTDDEEDDNALGHTSIICALLQSCHQDEMTETATNQNHTNQVALARVESEYESYPATLTQMLQEGSCFQPVLRRKPQTNLVIHILGAARDSELEWKNHKGIHWVDCYSQALSDLADSYQLKKIQIYFCGPDVVAADDDKMTPMAKDIQPIAIKAKKAMDRLELFLCPGHYTPAVVAKIPKVDIAVLFNPGLTCPDYPNWNNTLSCIPSGTPVLLCTNTQMEVLADIQFLLEHGHVRLSSLPPPWIGSSTPTMEDDAKMVVNPSEEVYFWGENPYCGWRVRQSGTMANDVYVKNRWMFGGFIDRRKGQPSARRLAPPSPLTLLKVPPEKTPLEKDGPKKHRKVEEKGQPPTRRLAPSKSPPPPLKMPPEKTFLEKEGPKKKRKVEEKVCVNKKSKNNSNSKRNNPALI